MGRDRTTGKLIVIEGIDQSGKRTQTKLLVGRAERAGFKCALWDFPIYETAFGKQIRAYLDGDQRPDLHAAHMLYALNRWEVAQAMFKQLAEGKILVANRYSQSNLAYGRAHGLPASFLNSLEDGLPKADLVILVDVPVRASFSRKAANRDRHEKDLAYLRAVRKAYLRLAAENGWVVVDGRRGPPEVHEAIWRAASKRIAARLTR